MRVLLTGSRGWSDAGRIWSELTTHLADALRAGEPFVLVHGACPTGADAIAERWARINGITPERHPAEEHGPWPACGSKRNQAMVQAGADLCLAFIGPCTSPRCNTPGEHPSHGATGCAALAEAAGIEVKRWTT